MAATEIETAADPTTTTSPSSTKKRKPQIDEIEVDLSLPEPPSKKAKRLLKKGKPLPTKPTSDDEDDDGLDVPKTKSKDGSGSGSGKDKKQRSEHGIWIGNLPFTMTRLELFKWLVECSGGVIKEENITRVNLPLSKFPVRENDTRGGAVGSDDGGDNKQRQQQKQNKGFAYVDFDVESAAIAAMALTETEINGRKVLIKSSTSFEGRPQQQASTTTQTADLNGNTTGASKTTATPANTSRKIYIGNLAFQVTEDDVRQQFEKCGEIDWVKIATFEDSGKCKGFGWVKFREAEAAAWAVKGFVKIREEIETEDDFRDDNDDDDDDDDDKPERKIQMRKWWVNRLHGRELKIELAEDDQTRYNKRYRGKGGAGKDLPPRRQQQQQQTSRNGGDGKENAAPAPKKRPAYGDADVASYKTGAVKKSEGKKITFE